MKGIRLRCPILLVAILFAVASSLHAAPWDPAAADYSGHEGKTVFVSKLGGKIQRGKFKGVGSL